MMKIFQICIFLLVGFGIFWLSFYQKAIPQSLSAESKNLESHLTLKGSISISGAWGLYPTVVAWAQAFQKIHPHVRIDVSAGGAGKGATDAILGLVDIGMVSRDPDPAEIEKNIKTIYVLQDAVLPIVSDKNFFKDVLLKRGLTKQEFKNLYILGTFKRWDEIPRIKKNDSPPGKPIHLYTRSDSCGAAASFSHYLGHQQEDLKGIGIFGDPGLIESVRRDPVGLGYSNMSFLFTRSGEILPGLKLLPIDVNENAKADLGELFLNRQQLVEAIYQGKYPVSRKNFFFIRENISPVVNAFIRFILSDQGDKIANEVAAGLPLTVEQRQQELKKLPEFSP